MSAGRRLVAMRGAAGSAPVALIVLVGANLIPLVGVLLLGWELMTVVVLYWVENGIVGVFNVLRMALAQGTGAGPLVLASARWAGAAKVVLIPFFLIHYGIFWFVHGMFVFLLPSITRSDAAGPVESYVAIGAVALALSHGTSFVANYLLRGEYRQAGVAELFGAPYGRVVVLHLTILVGAFAVLSVGEPVALVVVLVALKTALDLGLHLREHAARARSAAGAG